MISNLENISIQELEGRNAINHFYPFSNKDYVAKRQFSFDEVIGRYISFLTGKKLNNLNYEEFKKECLAKFKEVLDDEQYADTIQELYFDDENITLNSILTYQLHEAGNTSQKVYEIFRSMSKFDKLDINFEKNHNFFEEIILDLLKSYMIEHKENKSSSCYLPFLETLFAEDFKFITGNSHYFVKNIEKFLELYLFIYCSQLALNLKPNKNALSIPQAQDIYFILNYEKASTERRNVVDFGYQYLYDRAKYIFPYLSLLTIFMKVFSSNDFRLYNLLEVLDESDNSISILDNFNVKYREAKQLEALEYNSATINEALESLLDSAYDQFKENSVVDRKGALDKYLKAFENQVARPFLQNRGRLGKILVMDQDMILLLTNISIGNKSKLRFQELMLEFKKRGICFDTKSQVELVSLYEKIGNIERKSDSGDAIYVKTTI